MPAFYKLFLNLLVDKEVARHGLIRNAHTQLICKASAKVQWDAVCRLSEKVLWHF